MIAHRTFTDVRSYFFRAALANIDREQRQYGGRPLDAYRLEDFRSIHARATKQALGWRRSLRS
jgi:hypothetical protein